MFGFRSILATVFLTTAIVSRPVVAQRGTASSVHTVSVTVPPRIKVQISPLTPPSSATLSITSSNAGVAVNVSATQPWSLSIAAPARNSHASVKWSRSQQGAYAAITGSSSVASAQSVTASSDATVYLRADTAANTNSDADAPVVLTIVAR